MFVFDLTNSLTLILMLAATVLLIFLAQEIKKSAVAAIPLFVYLALVVTHTVQLLTLSEQFEYLFSTLCFNMAIDYVFIFITFISYLWVDDIEAKKLNKKSIDNSLDWFWKKI